MSKTCSKCATDKPLADFHADKHGKHGVRGECRSCVNARQRAQKATRYHTDPAFRAADHAKRAAYRQTTTGRASDRAHGKRRRAVKRGAATSQPVLDADLSAILAEFNYGCAYCPSPWAEWDHYLPINRGGTHTIDNLVPACMRCNRSKWAHLPIFEWTAARPSVSHSPGLNPLSGT